MLLLIGPRRHTYIYKEWATDAPENIILMQEYKYVKVKCFIGMLSFKKNIENEIKPV